MKKVLNVGIGGRSFTIDEDAYHKLDAYLKQFRQKAQMGNNTKEMMDELEMRIADLFGEELKVTNEVVNLSLVNHVVSRLGMPDGSDWESDAFESDTFESDPEGDTERPVRRLYRNPDAKVLGGVASGLAVYFYQDVVLFRLLFVVAFIFGSLGFWIYIIFWLVLPPARTAAQKCELRGIAVNAENLRKYSSKNL